MGGADAVVDVAPGRLVANGDDLGTEFMEHMRRDVVSGAVRRIDLQAGQQ